MVRWPEERRRLDELRASRVPRLLLIAPEIAAPDISDCLEDWVRLPAEDRDVRTRLATLLARAGSGHARPTIDSDGLLRFRQHWVSLSPVERSLASALVGDFGAVVARDSLAVRAWPTGLPTRNALDVHMLRLRRRIAPLGLEVRTVRSRGYLMQSS